MNIDVSNHHLPSQTLNDANDGIKTSMKTCTKSRNLGIISVHQLPGDMVCGCFLKPRPNSFMASDSSWVVNLLPPEIRPYQPLVSLNKVLLKPYFWRGTLGGVGLTSHDFKISPNRSDPPKENSMNKNPKGTYPNGTPKIQLPCDFM